jgi:hypothetical protein
LRRRDKYGAPRWAPRNRDAAPLLCDRRPPIPLARLDTDLGQTSEVSGTSEVCRRTVSLQVSASDPDGNPLFYLASGLPAGLSLDPSSGLISGTLASGAASSTPYSVTATASDGVASASQTFNWYVATAPRTAQASAVTAVEGNDTGTLTRATFTTPDLTAQASDRAGRFGVRAAAADQSVE